MDSTRPLKACSGIWYHGNTSRVLFYSAPPGIVIWVSQEASGMFFSPRQGLCSTKLPTLIKRFLKGSAGLLHKGINAFAFSQVSRYTYKAGCQDLSCSSVDEAPKSTILNSAAWPLQMAVGIPRVSGVHGRCGALSIMVLYTRIKDGSLPR
ncbi:uncharacterized protein LOC143928348 isoform X1 [Lithobates pipiens]